MKARDSAEAEVVKAKLDMAAEIARIKDKAGRLIQEVEEKGKAAVGSETA